MWRDARGFTLVEILTAITIMGVLFAIATTSWQGLVEDRRVTSATNQLTADLRLAHSKSTNQLKDYAVVTNIASLAIPGLAPDCNGSPADYYFVEVRNPITSSVTTAKCLPDRTEIDAAFGVQFKPEGSAGTVTGLATTTTVSTEDGAVNPPTPPKHDVSVQPQTSRVKID